jgi:hypothetical protein
MRKVLRDMRSPDVLAAFGLLAVFLVVTRLFGELAGVSFWYLAADIATALDAPVYVGFVSQVGLILWSAAAGVCLVTGTVLRSRRSRRAGEFYLASGSLTIVLMVDDAFLFHDEVGPKALGIPEVVALGVLGLAALVWLVRYRDVIRTTRTLPLLISVLCGVMSVAFDLAQQPIGTLPDHNLFEDGFKFIAIGGWLTYFARESVGALSGVPSDGEAPPS